ncbi:hypothetical protein [Sutterella wadsworthensis]
MKLYKKSRLFAEVFGFERLFSFDGQTLVYALNAHYVRAIDVNG